MGPAVLAQPGFANELGDFWPFWALLKHLLGNIGCVFYILRGMLVVFSIGFWLRKT